MILKRNKIVTYYEEYGDYNKPVLLLLHGIGADHNMWALQKKVFSNAGFRVVIPDLLGHGKSSKVDNLKLSDWGDQLEELLDFLDIKKVTAIGVSMGGVIAQYFVMNYQERVEGVVIADSFGELKTIEEKFTAYLQLMGFRFFKLIGNKAYAKGMANTYKSDYAKLARKYYSNVSLDVDMDQLVLARKAINKIDILDRLKFIKLPSLVMAGDGLGKFFVNINKKVADALNSRLIILNNSMDPSNLVKPDEFNKNVLDFLKLSFY